MDQADIIKRIAEAMSASMNAAKIVETNNERFGGPQKAGKKFVEYWRHPDRGDNQCQEHSQS